MYCSKTQKGSVLILALVVVVLVTSIAAVIQSQFQRSINSVESAVYREQSRRYLDATVTLAETLLSLDTSEDYDARDDLWLQPTGPISLDSGTMSAALYDAHAKFNLNALRGLGEGVGEDFSVAQRRFIRLLQSFDEVPVTQFEAEKITRAVADWIDEGETLSDIESAETNYYSTLSPVAYRSANRPFESVSELQLVRGFTPALYRVLKPYLVALPTNKQVLNLNTAPVVLLRSLNVNEDLSPLSEYEAQAFFDRVAKAPYQSVSSLMQDPLMERLSEGGSGAANDLTVTSRFVLVDVDLVWRDRSYIYSSLLERNEETVTLIKKSYGLL